MNAYSDEVALGFSIDQKKYIKRRKGYIYKKDKKIINEVNFNKKNILTQYNIKEYIYNKGFKNICRYDLSINNTPYYEYNDKIYTMNDYIEGREILVEDREILPNVFENLALFHKAAKGIECSEECIIKSKLGTLPSLYKKRIIELKRIKKIIYKRTKYLDMDLIFLENYKEEIDLCIQALDILNDSNYYKLVNKASKEKDLIHNNYNLYNLYTYRGKIYTKDYSKCVYDLRLNDIAYSLNKIMKNYNWNYDLFEKLYYSYKNIYDISYDENIVLYAMLVFPNKYTKICNKYYNSRKTIRANKYINSMNKLLYQNKNKKLCIEKFKKNIIEKNVDD